MQKASVIYGLLTILASGIAYLGWQTSLLHKTTERLSSELEKLTQKRAAEKKNPAATDFGNVKSIAVVPTSGTKSPEVMATMAEEKAQPESWLVPGGSGTFTPPKGASAVEGPDTTLIQAARALQTQPAGEARSSAWANLVDKANYYELVRMTEVLSQPPASKKLDGDRLGLRRQVIQRLAAVGKLEIFIQAREAFEWPRVSNPLEMAYEESAMRDPFAALRLWEDRENRLPEGGQSLGDGVVLSMARSLARVNLVKAEPIIQQLPQVLRIRLEDALRNSGVHGKTEN